MSDEGFLKRWSRKKRAETPAAESESAERPLSQPSPAAREKETPESLPPQSGGRLEGCDSATPASKAEDEAIDPAMLPPIESLGPASDYTVFLKKGVPEALRVAALRRAWMSDPFIRDFRGPAEYALDYTTAEFDLRPTDDVAKMLDRIFPPRPASAAQSAGAGVDAAAPAPDGPLPAPPAAETSGRSDERALPEFKAASPAPVPVPPLDSDPALPRRRHGGALPDDPD